MTHRPPADEPFDDLDDDELDQLLTEDAAADQHAAAVLREALATHRGVPAPPELAEAALAVRSGLKENRYPLEWIARASGRAGDRPRDDEELLLSLTAGTIFPVEETGLDIEEESMLVALERADWLGAIVSLVRAGPGTSAAPDDLADGIARCPEVDSSAVGEDDEDFVSAALGTVTLAWSALGLLDRDERVTPLGVWVLPRALARAWGAEFDTS